jgi:hypothetical protein
MAQQGDTHLDCEAKTIKLNLERNKEPLCIDLKFIADKHKYVVAG